MPRLLLDRAINGTRTARVPVLWHADTTKLQTAPSGVTSAVLGVM